MVLKKYCIVFDFNEIGWLLFVLYIIGNEGCEWFSFYGMKVILYVYFVGFYINYLKIIFGLVELEVI